MSRRWLGPTLFVAFCLFALIILLALGDALIPLLVAALLAYLISPVVKRFEARGFGKSTSLALTLALVSLPLILLIGVLVPVLFHEAKSLAADLPQIIERAIHRVQVLAVQFDLELPLEKDELIALTKSYVSQISVSTFKSIGAFFGKTLSGAAGVLLAVLNFLLIPIFFIYLIHDFESILRTARDMIPSRSRSYFDSFARRSSLVISGYFRGQLLVSLILGLFYGVGFWLVDLRFGFVIGFITGLLNLIPYAGPIIGLATATAVGLANFNELSSTFLVWAVFAVVQCLEGFVITPRIVGDRVGLNSLETMLVLIIGGNVAGLMGMLIAIPIGAILKFLLKDAYSLYLRTEFYSHPQ